MHLAVHSRFTLRKHTQSLKQQCLVRMPYKYQQKLRDEIKQRFFAALTFRAKTEDIAQRLFVVMLIAFHFLFVHQQH